MNVRGEIGSEFELTPQFGDGFKLEIKDNYYITYTLSGRTAIDLVINDLKTIHKVCVPSYCCNSMLVPFIDSGIEIEYYNVYYEKQIIIDLTYSPDCDALLIMSYFGFTCDIDQNILREFKQNGGIIIEDVSHMLFSLDKHNLFSDYLVASVRKWGGLVSGGLIAKKGEPIEQRLDFPDLEFVNNKYKAMKLKTDYLSGIEIDKNQFLKIYKDSNAWIANNYKRRSIDQISIEILSSWNTEKIINKRRENTIYLYQILKETEDIKPLFELEKMNCPLFLPVIIKDGKRSNVQITLINKGIYCPVHWPKPGLGEKSNLYELELSLVCDQRYDISDMQMIGSVLKENRW